MSDVEPEVPVDDRVGLDPTLVNRIASMVPDPSIDASVVHRVLSALNQAKQGPGLGTVYRQPQTGATATRIDRNGMHMWSIIDSDGTQSYSLEPELKGWRLLFSPDEA